MTVAVLDACVLYPPALRDLLMWVASSGVYEPRWTNEIHAEWMRSVLANRSEATAVRLERTRRLMDQVGPDVLVSDYEPYMDALLLPDPNDRHVLAAAIKAGASRIVTFNLSDFPDSALLPHGIRAAHPDHFLSALFEETPELFLLAMRTHRASLRNPPKTRQDYLDTLRAGRLTSLAQRVEAHGDAL